MWLTPKNAPLWLNGCTHTGHGGMAHAWGSAVGLTYQKNFSDCHSLPVSHCFNRWIDRIIHWVIHGVLQELPII